LQLTAVIKINNSSNFLINNIFGSIKYIKIN